MSKTLDTDFNQRAYVSRFDTAFSVSRVGPVKNESGSSINEKNPNRNNGNQRGLPCRCDAITNVNRVAIKWKVLSRIHRHEGFVARRRWPQNFGGRWYFVGRSIQSKNWVEFRCCSFEAGQSMGDTGQVSMPLSGSGPATVAWSNFVES